MTQTRLVFPYDPSPSAAMSVDGEVTEAWWEPPFVVAALLADPASPLVPDTRELMTPFFR